MAACTNPDILKVIYFFNIIIDIIRIIIPIALIILGIIDFSKSVINSDEKSQKKSFNLFLKRLFYGILVFTVPWVVEVLMVTLGNLLDKDNMGNFTDCIENANSDKIAELEKEAETGLKAQCYQCNSNGSLRVWSVGSPSQDNCGGGWHERTDLNKKSCK